MTRPMLITDAARIAHDTILRRTSGDTELADIIRDGIYDAYRVGANRALEAAAGELEETPDIDWITGGTAPGAKAAALVRSRKINPEKET